MKINYDLCIRCESCMDNCPMLAIYKDRSTQLIVINQDKCIECEACKEACPRLAIKEN